MLNPNTPDAVNLIHEGLVALSRASQYGMAVDVDYCRKMDKVLTKKIKRMKDEFFESKTGSFWKKIYKNPNVKDQIPIEIQITKFQNLLLILWTKNRRKNKGKLLGFLP